MFTKEWYKTHKHPRGMLGKKQSDYARLKISKIHKGKTNSIETRNKMSLARIAEKNPMWKGNEVGYVALHNWIRRRLVYPEKCECGFIGVLDLCNISGKYLRDIKDWEYLCRRCHMNKDNRINNRGIDGKFQSKGVNY